MTPSALFNSSSDRVVLNGGCLPFGMLDIVMQSKVKVLTFISLFLRLALVLRFEFFAICSAVMGYISDYENIRECIVHPG